MIGAWFLLELGMARVTLLLFVVHALTGAAATSNTTISVEATNVDEQQSGLAEDAFCATSPVLPLLLLVVMSASDAVHYTLHTIPLRVILKLHWHTIHWHCQWHTLHTLALPAVSGTLKFKLTALALAVRQAGPLQVAVHVWYSQPF